MFPQSISVPPAVKRCHLFAYLFLLSLLSFLEKCVMMSGWILQSVKNVLSVYQDHHGSKIRRNHSVAVRHISVRRQVLPLHRRCDQVAPHVWDNLIADSSSWHLNLVDSCQTSHAGRLMILPEAEMWSIYRLSPRQTFIFFPHILRGKYWDIVMYWNDAGGLEEDSNFFLTWRFFIVFQKLKHTFTSFEIQYVWHTAAKEKVFLFRLFYYIHIKIKEEHCEGFIPQVGRQKLTCEASQIQQLKVTNSHIFFFFFVEERR